MFSGDHAKPSTEALCNYDVHIDHGDDYVAEQGGRSCAGARVAAAEKFGLGRKF